MSTELPPGLARSFLCTSARAHADAGGRHLPAATVQPELDAEPHWEDYVVSCLPTDRC